MIFVLIFGVADVLITTVLYLRFGTTVEANPFARYLMLHFGITSVYALKAISLTVFVAVIKALREDGSIKSKWYNAFLYVFFFVLHIAASFLGAVILMGS